MTTAVVAMASLLATEQAPELLVNIETPSGLRHAAEIGRAHPRVAGLQLGLGDLFESLGIERRDPANLHAVLYALRMAAAEAGRSPMTARIPMSRTKPDSGSKPGLPAAWAIWARAASIRARSPWPTRRSSRPRKKSPARGGSSWPPPRRRSGGWAPSCWKVG